MKARALATHLAPWEALAMCTTPAKLCRVAAVAVTTKGVPAVKFHELLLAMGLEISPDFAADLQRDALLEDVEGNAPAVPVLPHDEAVAATVDEKDRAGVHAVSVATRGAA